MQQPVKAVSITVDSREGRARTADALARLPGVTVEVLEMPIGDYACKNIVVERKDGPDFVASILDGRLFAQVELMSAAYEVPVVIVEGDPYQTISAIERVSVTGAISWLAVLSGVQLVYSTSTANTVELIHRMAIHATHGLGYIPPFRGNKPKLDRVVARYLVEGLPGVGPTTAEALIEHFGSAGSVFKADEKALQQVRGVGATMARKIRAALDATI